VQLRPGGGTLKPRSALAAKKIAEGERTNSRGVERSAARKKNFRDWGKSGGWGFTHLKEAGRKGKPEGYAGAGRSSAYIPGVVGKMKGKGSTRWGTCVGKFWSGTELKQEFFGVKGSTEKRKGKGSIVPGDITSNRGRSARGRPTQVRPGGRETAGQLQARHLGEAVKASFAETREEGSAGRTQEVSKQTEKK